MPHSSITRRAGRLTTLTVALAATAGIITTAPALASTETSTAAPTKVSRPGSAAAPVPSTCPANVAAIANCFTGQDRNGAFYAVAIPHQWNKSLVVHAHGGPDLGDASDPTRSVDDLDRWSVMVKEGYAWVGSSYRRGGYGTQMAAIDTEGARKVFVNTWGAREHRLWADRDAWLPSIDILKMNLEEAGCSWMPGPGDDRKPGDPIAVDQLPDFAAHVLGQGVKAVCVTLDQEGCVAYTLDDSGALLSHVVPRIPIEDVVDTTGCGDSFAAGMAFGYLQDGDIVRACQYGNAMGAQRASASELDGYLPLAQTDAQLAQTYGGTAAAAPVGG